jgi:two-component system, chemotaxis family, chemotaxis protein CheY
MMAGRRVLIIDDDMELLRQMVLAFRSRAFDVIAAPDGQAGLAQFAKAPRDLVVTDIIMPNREGIETIVALKKARPSVKVIAISGGYRVGPKDFLKLAGHVGADAVLPKPFKLSELLDSAERLLTPANACAQ